MAARSWACQQSPLCRFQLCATSSSSLALDMLWWFDNLQKTWLVASGFAKQTPLTLHKLWWLPSTALAVQMSGMPLCCEAAAIPPAKPLLVAIIIIPECLPPSNIYSVRLLSGGRIKAMGLEELALYVVLVCSGTTNCRTESLYWKRNRPLLSPWESLWWLLTGFHCMYMDRLQFEEDGDGKELWAKDENSADA